MHDRGHVRILGGALLLAVCAGRPGQAGTEPPIGINVVLSVPATDGILADLATQGVVLDVVPEIRAVTLRAPESALPGLLALPFVAAANPDRERAPLDSGASVLPPDLADGANRWDLDAMDVTDADDERTVDATGEGVYVAVLDTGLVSNWREYFPEERIDAVHARAFGGGGGNRGTVTERPSLWEHDTVGHGTEVISVLLGFRYEGPEDLPPAFAGVAPRATVLPIKVFENNQAVGYHQFRNFTQRWSSVVARAIVYLVDLKARGALGDAPLVVSMSFGGSGADAMEQAAIDHAVANGVVVVAGAGNDGDRGIQFPAAYPPVISVANAGWVDAFPSDDPTIIEWIRRDVPEDDASAFYMAPDSSRERPGQELDVAAPGTFVPVAWTRDGRADYTFVTGTSFACPHASGLAALMLERNGTLEQAEVEGILRDTALALPAGCRDTRFVGITAGDLPTWSDHDNVIVFDLTVCWGTNATGSGLVRAGAAMAATPAP